MYQSKPAQSWLASGFNTKFASLYSEVEIKSCAVTRHDEGTLAYTDFSVLHHKLQLPTQPLKEKMLGCHFFLKPKLHSNNSALHTSKAADDEPFTAATEYILAGSGYGKIWKQIKSYSKCSTFKLQSFEHTKVKKNTITKVCQIVRHKMSLLLSKELCWTAA